MREIKFKAWDKEKKEMINFEQENIDYYVLHIHQCDGEGHYCVEFNNSEDEPVYYEQERFILLQFTGLTDSEGKDIYEGDIVKLPRDKKPFEVVMHYGTWSLREDIESYHYSVTLVKYLKGKVVGNIYEGRSDEEGL